MKVITLYFFNTSSPQVRILFVNAIRSHCWIHSSTKHRRELCFPHLLFFAHSSFIVWINHFSLFWVACKLKVSMCVLSQSFSSKPLLSFGRTLDQIQVGFFERRGGFLPSQACTTEIREKAGNELFWREAFLICSSVCSSTANLLIHSVLRKRIKPLTTFWKMHESEL